MTEISLESNPNHKRIAAIVTEYRYNSHADVILGRLLGDFAYQPQIEVVSIYTDQVPVNDMSREAAARLGIPIYPTIREAIRNQQGTGPIDGVVIIGEHGAYPYNEKGQMMYPRRRMLEETLAALDELQLVVPIFSDKHLSYDYQDAVWMYTQLKSRGIPFMGGSSIPFSETVPPLNPHKLQSAAEILVVSHSPLVEAYGFHALEVLQSLAEQRECGECGVHSVQFMQGPEVWECMDRKEWPEDLLLQALDTYPDLPNVHPRELDSNPMLMVVQYVDGPKGYVVQFNKLVEQWAACFRTKQGETAAVLFNSGLDRPFVHFEHLTKKIEYLIMSGVPPFPMERTLMTTALTCAVVDAAYYGPSYQSEKIDIVYKPMVKCIRNTP
ncbi:hypothetical protein [Paenibacillus terrigena]|uniref:hypothetical protein n=1 Tax=Paenibacillus terrigena TaxID=369333 RepID=UPI00036AD3A5|nr:hypothetical protein [Paenibacillus terrigena]